MRIKELTGKALRTLTDEGALSVFKKTVNYLSFKLRARRKSCEMKDVLFINGCTLPHPERYRVDHQIEQLESCGFSVEKVLYTEVSPDIVKFYHAVVVFRCPITPEVKKLIETAHCFNKTVFYDVDDLVIDTKYTDRVEYIQQMNEDERRLYNDGVKRMGATMKMCDYCITTTSALARELRKYGKEVFVNRNVASEKMVRLSLDAVDKVVKDKSKVRIGYLSGSITHNPDFEMIKPVLIRIMQEYSQVELLIMGHLDLPKEFEKYDKRIVRQSFRSWEELPDVIAGLDINLAPIEETIFNEAKSENKWTEASLCRVVTVASDYGSFKEVIVDGETGMLCRSENDWYEKIKELIENKDLRDIIAEKAYHKVMKEYITTYSGRDLADFIKSKLAKSIAFVLPSTNISGGVNVVLKHCEILRRNGWDVVVINMDISDENIINIDGEVNVVSGVNHEIHARFDEMVATLYTTVKYVKEYANVVSRRYLVQGFETDFNDYGSPIRREANATYYEDGFQYLTVSKWCKDWLMKDFGRRVLFAPNGIDLARFNYHEREFGGKIRILIEGNSDDYYKNVDEGFKIIEKLDAKKYDVVYLSYHSRPKEWYRVDEFYQSVPHDEVGKIYGDCDILLKTSILESFSYPPLEMMATGGLVVAIPNDGNKEYLKDGYNCLFYEKGDVGEAVEKIEQLVSDIKLRSQLARNGRKTAEERDWSKIENKVMDLYK